MLFGADLAARAAPGAFDPKRYRAEIIAVDSLFGSALIDGQVTVQDIASLTSNAPAWRLIRTQPFDDGLPL